MTIINTLETMHYLQRWPGDDTEAIWAVIDAADGANDLMYD